MNIKKSPKNPELFVKIDFLQDVYNNLKYSYSLDIVGLEYAKQEMNRLYVKRFDMESDRFFKAKLKIVDRKLIIKNRIKETVKQIKVVKKELKENLDLWAKQ